jgi:hypothetical protein
MQPFNEAVESLNVYMQQAGGGGLAVSRLPQGMDNRVPFNLLQRQRGAFFVTFRDGPLQQRGQGLRFNHLAFRQNVRMLNHIG